MEEPAVNGLEDPNEEEQVPDELDHDDEGNEEFDGGEEDDDDGY